MGVFRAILRETHEDVTTLNGRARAVVFSLSPQVAAWGFRVLFAAWFPPLCCVVLWFALPGRRLADQAPDHHRRGFALRCRERVKPRAVGGRQVKVKAFFLTQLFHILTPLC